ncbi:MAG: hypothetical protein QME51_11170 [Planctomycetota bacterium]|nr:hypothetical protein [Planctomycetota bacterium]
MPDNNNGVLSGEIQRQIQTDEGFKLFVAINLQEIKVKVINHEKRIDVIEKLKDKLWGIWIAGIFFAGITAGAILYVIDKMWGFITNK